PGDRARVLRRAAGRLHRDRSAARLRHRDPLPEPGRPRGGGPVRVPDRGRLPAAVATRPGRPRSGGCRARGTAPRARELTRASQQRPPSLLSLRGHDQRLRVPPDGAYNYDQGVTMSQAVDTAPPPVPVPAGERIL